jgi:hypothetical protein
MTDAPSLADSQPPSSIPGLPPAPAALRAPDRLILLALLLGLSVDYFFYDKSIGISFPLFITLGVLAVLAAALAERVRPALSSLWLIVPLIGFASMVFVRAEPLTTFVNVAVVLALGALWVRTFENGRLFRFGLLDMFVAFCLTAAELAVRPWPLLASARRQTMSDDGRRRMLLPVLRGLLLAAPILCVFTVLLGSADLVFGDRLHDILEALNLDNLPELFWRSLLVGAAAFVVIGLLVQALRPFQFGLIGEDGRLLPRFLGLTESVVVLGGINLLFAAFVLIQFQYLFGGTTNINTAGYTYSEYARQGFGELAAVVLMSLLILLALSAGVRRDSRRDTLTFNSLNLLMAALVGVMVVSSLQRLLLYEEIFGFTRLRTYSHVAILWLGALFLPYLVALLAGRMRWFAPGALLAVLGFAATLNGLNVDRFIAAQNISRLSRGHELHARYLITLSDDALPELLTLLDHNDPALGAVLGPGLVCRLERLAGEEARAAWQSWHLSRQAAWEALRDRPDLSRYRLIHHPYGDYLYVGEAREMCSRLLQSFVLEPGLTSEYRTGED